MWPHSHTPTTLAAQSPRCCPALREQTACTLCEHFSVHPRVHDLCPTGSEELQIDLKGVLFSAHVLPLAGSAMVINITPTEAKVGRRVCRASVGTIPGRCGWPLASAWALLLFVLGGLSLAVGQV